MIRKNVSLSFYHQIKGQLLSAIYCGKIKEGDRLPSIRELSEDLGVNYKTVRKIYLNNKMIEVTGVGYAAEGNFLHNDQRIDPAEDERLALLLRASTLCTNAQYDGKSVIGDTTEGALIVAAAKAGMTKEELERR